MPTPQAVLAELKAHLQFLSDLGGAVGLLRWDQVTYMPQGGASARSRHIATLSRIWQEAFTAPQIQEWLDVLVPYAETLPYDDDDAALIRYVAREYDRRRRIPTDFVAEMSRHLSASRQAWGEARQTGEFATVQPFLEKTLDFSRRMADYLGPYDHPMDPLIQQSDEGFDTATIRALFDTLQRGLVPLVRAIADAPRPNTDFLAHTYDFDTQMAFLHDVLTAFGYDWQRGRHDLTAHPFAIRLSHGDVRITTRFTPDYLNAPLFPSMHESGHAIYEQNVSPRYDGTPLARGAWSGVHESSSRLWENRVGRSRPVWGHYYPRFQRLFADHLAHVPLDDFYAAINVVEPSFIRVTADEVTYNLHIMIRFELEAQLLEGSLSIAELPEAWNAMYEEFLGVRPPNHKVGVLQDVHWYNALIGGRFQGYALGNIIGAQLFEAIQATHPDIEDHIAAGEFDTLRGWLTEHVYRHGRKYLPLELVERATGKPLSVEPLLRYLYAKFGDLYGLNLEP
ncbi:MAG: carboxypeptidase M32 [Ardenticatenia bacterium]|nr:MAG: carboxypeptidase M32 [Ardenticatenia bacterium]